MKKRLLKTCRPFMRRAAAELLGLACWAAAGGWLYLDIKPDGQVSSSTAIGVLLLGCIGGWLIDKEKTREALTFLKEQGKSLLDVVRTGGDK